MGKISKGILGGFSGKVGTVIGASWRGIHYMRSIPQSVRNPRTDGQRSQRNKFSLVVAFLKPLNSLLRTGFKNYANRQSPFNAATSFMLANAITGEYPNYEIDASKVLVSRGSLTPALNASAKVENDNLIVTWSDNSNVGDAQPSDRVLIAVVKIFKKREKKMILFGLGFFRHKQLRICQKLGLGFFRHK